MSMIDDLLGRRPVREDFSALPPGTYKQQRPAPVRQLPPKDKEEDKLRKKARQSSVVACILGMTESDDEGIIPPDAKQVDTFSAGERIPGIRSDPLPQAEGPEEPAVSNVSGEELIQPQAALVAPDITPNVMQPLDPSQVPAPPRPPQAPLPPMTGGNPELPGEAARGVMNTILGRQNAGSQPQAPAPSQAELESMAASTVAAMTNPIVIQEKVAEALTPAQPGTSTMPDHREGDGKSVYTAFRKFM